LLAAWNAPVVTMLKRKGENFCWGGGTAIRRSIFEQSGVLDEWKNSVSDDYSLTRALERKNHPILFLPECLTLSYVETDFDGLLEFTNRQILITRVYADKVWARAAATHFLYCLTLVLGVVLILGNLLAQRPAFISRRSHFCRCCSPPSGASIRLIGVTEAVLRLGPRLPAKRGFMCC